MNVAELERLLDDACHCIDLGCGWSCDAYIADRLIRRVIAAEKLVAQIKDCIAFRFDPNIGIELNRLEEALTAYEATK